MAITYSAGVYTLSTSGNYTPTDLYSYNSAGITRLNGSRIVYDFGSSRIIVGSGTTLTIDTSDIYGEIMFSDPGWNGSDFRHHIKVNSGGTLNLGHAFSQDVIIVAPAIPSLSYLDANRHYYIQGELNWNGGIIVGGTIQLYSGATGSISGYATMQTIGVESASIRASDPNFGYDRCRMFGGAIVPFVETTNPFKGFTFIDCMSQPTIGVGIANAWMLCEDWDVSDPSNLKGFGFWDRRWARYINQATGTDFVTGGNLPDHSNNRGLCEVRQSIEFSADNGSSAKFYTRDTNNGSRLAANQINSNPNYQTDRTYTLTESGGTASYTIDGGVLIGVHWRTTGGLDSANNQFDSRGLANNKTDVFNWLKVQYGRQPATQDIIMKGVGGVSAGITSLPDLGITETTKATVAAYTGITPEYTGGTLTVTVTENHSWDEIYDYIKYWESENPAKVWSNSKTSFVSTSDKLLYNFTNFDLVVDGAELICSTGQVLPSKPTIINGGFFEDNEGAIWKNGDDLYYARHAYINIKDAFNSGNIEGATVDWGDLNTETPLAYDLSLNLNSLVADSNGDTEGYFVYKINSTVYDSLKMCVKKTGYESYSSFLASSGNIYETISLKKNISVMTSTDGRVAVKLDPTNSNINRDKVVIL
jgi:hypothetical protein